MVGYAVRDPESGLVVNQLSGLDGLDTAEWQPVPTVWQQHPDVPSAVISAERYRHSGLTRAILRGGDYVAAQSNEQRLASIDAFFRSTAEGVAYVYVPELDQAAHQYGVASPQWVRRLEELDGFVSDVCSRLSPRDGLIVTADHGVLDVPTTRHRIIPGDSPLLRDVVTGGEPRCLHLYTERDSTELASLWRSAEESHAFVATRAEAIAAGWFGTVTHAHLPRIGDVVVIPRHQAVYYDERTATTQSMAMIGQHGGLSRTETHVPLVRAGLFA